MISLSYPVGKGGVRQARESKKAGSRKKQEEERGREKAKEKEK
jgi:hypothetical protein